MAVPLESLAFGSLGPAAGGEIAVAWNAVGFGLSWEAIVACSMAA